MYLGHIHYSPSPRLLTDPLLHPLPNFMPSFHDPLIPIGAIRLCMNAELSHGARETHQGPLHEED